MEEEAEEEQQQMQEKETYDQVPDDKASIDYSEPASDSESGSDVGSEVEAEAASEEPRKTIEVVEIPPAIIEYLDNIASLDIKHAIDNMVIETNRFNLENLVFTNFFMANDPSYLLGLDLIMDAAYRAHQAQLQKMEPAGSDRMSVASSDVTRRSIFSNILAPQSGPMHGPRINLNCRTDLVLREVEDMQNQLELFFKRSHAKKCRLKAELEEIGIRSGETIDATAAFEQIVVIEGLDPISQKITAERFTKYMNDWLKSAQFTIDKMRLRCSTLKSRLFKLSTLLVQKAELGENIHEVDFEKITIENERFQIKIEQKNNHLIEIKRMLGNANLVLTNYKNYLQNFIDELTEIKGKIDMCHKKTEILDVEGERAAEQVEQETEVLEKLKELVDNYRVPDVMEYVTLKNDLYELKKMLKVWHRKMGIQIITLQTCKSKLAKLLGLETAKKVLGKIKRQEHFEIEDLVIDWDVTNRDSLLDDSSSLSPSSVSGEQGSQDTDNFPIPM